VFSSLFFFLLLHTHVQIAFDFASLTQAHETEVEGIAFDAHQRRLATVGGGCLKVWDMDVNGQLSLVAGAPQRPYIARSVAFFDKGQAVLVCYLENHEV
jgi:hypothetical protein